MKTILLLSLFFVGLALVPDSKGADVEGVAFLDANNNGQDDDGGNVGAGATVQLIDEEGNVIATATTGEGGRYFFPDVADGNNYKIRLLGVSRYADSVLFNVSGDAITSTDGAITMTSVPIPITLNNTFLLNTDGTPSTQNPSQQQQFVSDFI